MIRLIFRALLPAAIFLYGQAAAGEEPLPLQSPAEVQSLINRLWRAPAAEQPAIGRELEAAAPDVTTLYQWLRHGPLYTTDAPGGEVQLERTGSDRLSYPYVVLVPEDYDPARPWPVEFNLHGGVNRPRTPAGESWWRNGYDSLRQPDRIVVVPAAWNEAYWWFANQAENLPAILRSVKQTWHVDENRVYLSGISDGGTGAFFFAFFMPTPWAAFLPYIANPGVLRNPNGEVSYPLFYENLRGKPLYIVTGENDPLYPAHAIRPHIERMEEAGVPFTWVVIPEGGHNTAWMPEQAPLIEDFKATHVRDPHPDAINWTAVRIDRYNRNHWLRIDGRSLRGEPARIEARRDGNRYLIEASGVSKFTLLLSPAETDFTLPVTIVFNGDIIHADLVEQRADTLLEWLREDLDRTMLYTAELTLTLP